MKVTVTKSKTVKNGENYSKTEYALESEGIDPDVLRNQLEGKIDSWLGVSKPNAPVSSAQKTCEKCGNPVKGTYKLCYACWKAKQ